MALSKGFIDTIVKYQIKNGIEHVECPLCGKLASNTRIRYFMCVDCEISFEICYKCKNDKDNKCMIMPVYGVNWVHHSDVELFTKKYKCRIIEMTDINKHFTIYFKKTHYYIKSACLNGRTYQPVLKIRGCERCDN